MAQVRAGSSSAAQHARVQLAGVPDDPVARRAARRSGRGATAPARRRARSARRPRRRPTTPGGLAPRRPSRPGGPGPTSRAARGRRSAPTATCHGCGGHRAQQRGERLVVRAAGRRRAAAPAARRSPREHRARARTAPRSRWPRDEVAGQRSPSRPGSSVVRSSGSSSDSGLRTHDDLAARVVVGQAERVEGRRRRRTGRPSTST